MIALIVRTIIAETLANSKLDHYQSAGELSAEVWDAIWYGRVGYLDYDDSDLLDEYWHWFADEDGNENPLGLDENYNGEQA